jgi:hypothetical protein
MDESRATQRVAISFGLILVCFKVWTVVLIFRFSWDWDTVRYLLMNHVVWIVVGAVIAWGPALFWLRLVCLRARRRQLLRSEWEVED